MMFLEFLPEIIIGIVMLAGIVIYAINFFKASPEEKKAIIADILYALAIKAEQAYGSKTGQAKKAQVIEWFYEKHAMFAHVLTKEQLGVYIDEAVDKMNDWLKDNPIGATNILGTKEETAEVTPEKK